MCKIKEKDADPVYSVPKYRPLGRGNTQFEARCPSSMLWGFVANAVMAFVMIITFGVNSYFLISLLRSSEM